MRWWCHNCTIFLFIFEVWVWFPWCKRLKIHRNPKSICHVSTSVLCAKWKVMWSMERKVVPVCSTNTVGSEYKFYCLLCHPITRENQKEWPFSMAISTLYLQHTLIQKLLFPFRAMHRYRYMKLILILINSNLNLIARMSHNFVSDWSSLLISSQYLLPKRCHDFLLHFFLTLSTPGHQYSYPLAPPSSIAL